MAEKPINQLIHETLSLPGNQELLAQLVARQKDFSEFLDCAMESENPTDLSVYNSEWVGTVLAALGASEDQTLGLFTKYETQRILKEVRAENEEAGRRFAELLKSLPPFFSKFSERFGTCPFLPDEIAENIFQRGDFDACPVSTKFLATRGIGPIEFIQAADAVGDLFNRMIDHQLINDPNHIVVDHRRVGGVTPLAEVVMDEISLIVECVPETAEAIYRWLRGAVKHQPTIFPRYHAVLIQRKDGMVLSKVAEEDKK